jgi:hypothetical protein
MSPSTGEAEGSIWEELKFILRQLNRQNFVWKIVSDYCLSRSSENTSPLGAVGRGFFQVAVARDLLLAEGSWKPGFGVIHGGERGLMNHP